MRYVLCFFAICGAFIVALALFAKLYPFKSKTNDTANIDSVADILISDTVASDFENTDAFSPTPTQASTPTPEPTLQPTPSPTPKHINEDSFFVGNAPYEMVDKVEFSTLININHRLSKDYVPTDLVRATDYVDTSIVSVASYEPYADKTALEAFNDMMKAANADGVKHFYLRNGYRSYNTQVGLWNMRVRQDSHYGRKYGTPIGSAYPGSSEHQTGLALDITCTFAKEPSTSFKDTANYKWLRDNSYKFGFILRYNSDKTDITGIKYEPYHYRFVGVELSTTLYKSGLSLEEYYGEPVFYF